MVAFVVYKKVKLADEVGTLASVEGGCGMGGSGAYSLGAVHVTGSNSKQGKEGD